MLMKFLGVKKHDYVSHKEKVKVMLSSGIIIRIHSVVRNLLNTSRGGKQDKLHLTQM